MLFRSLVNGEASMARFQSISDFVFYKPERIAIADFTNNCIRDLDLESNSVSNMAGICKMGSFTSHDFMYPRSLVYLRHQSYFIVSVHKSATSQTQLVTIDLPSGVVSSFNVVLRGMYSLLLDESETVLYVSYWNGLAKVDLIFNQSAGLREPMNSQVMKLHLIHYMVWLVNGEIIAAVTDQRVAVIDLQLRDTYFLCSGEYLFTPSRHLFLYPSVFKCMLLYLMHSLPQEFAIPHCKPKNIS